MWDKLDFFEGRLLFGKQTFGGIFIILSDVFLLGDRRAAASGKGMDRKVLPTANITDILHSISSCQLSSVFHRPCRLQ